MSHAVTIAQFTYRHEAEFARGFLEDAGIVSSVIVDDHAGHLTLNNTAKVLVGEPDVEAAREVLRRAGMEPS